jgi:hypothetical protein
MIERSKRKCVDTLRDLMERRAESLLGEKMNRYWQRKMTPARKISVAPFKKPFNRK